MTRETPDLTRERDDAPGTGTNLQVAVTAAFLTGRPVRVRIADYDKLQTSLSTELQRLNSVGWSVDPAEWRQGGTHHSGGGFTSMLPLVLARREGPGLLARGQAALDARPEVEHAWLREQAHDWDIALRSLRVDVYDLGMAVMNGTFSIHAPGTLGLEEAARTFKRLVWLKPDPDAGVESPISGAFRELARESAEQFARATDGAVPDAVQPAWLAPFLEAAGRGAVGSHKGDWGRLLWLHPVYRLDLSDPALDLAEDAARLAPPFFRTLAIPDGVFVAGIGWSAIVTRPASADAEIPLRLLELHWAYIALYMEIDRGLLALLDDDRWYEPESLAELERDAERVFGDYMRVMEARARLDSWLAGLGGDEYAMWEVIADVCRFDPLVEGVDRKVEAVQSVAERRVQQAAATRARRTGAVLSGLTALTIVTVAIALIGNFLGSRSDALGHIELRVAVVSAALALAVVLYREAHRERVRGRDRAAARRR